MHFDELLKDVTRTGTKIPSSNYEEVGLYPVIDQGKELIAGYSNLEKPIEGEKIIFGDHTRVLKYIDLDSFHIGADGVKVLENKMPEKVSTKYIYYYLSFIKIPNTGYNRHFKYLKEIVIPVPSFVMQLKLVELFDHVGKIIIKRQSQISSLDELTQSVFIEMFQDNKDSSKVSIEQVVDSIEAGWSVSGEERAKKEKEIAVLKISAVTKGYFNDKEYKVLNPNIEIKKAVYPQKGDILFSRANTRELVGASAIVPKDYRDLILPDKLWKINLRKEIITSEYFHTAINTKKVRNKFSKNATGTSGSMLNISMQKFKGVEINLPSIEKQKLFSKKFIQIQQMKQNLISSQEEVNVLYNSLLQKAFKGELFQQ
ncbi:hypothetical protein AN965_10660 [Alkalicoccobacillus plakortidis]|uniref:Type I restriction modification DNA specificity domain-containing protein n=1 Tax=Alkalicoccobacillus plakortidis TaxID=444060 RepID=A0A9D5I100_9BACI|nr:hypothetical protein AN965_10660 [Alkalicoccobacillus plakortidis]